MRGMPWIKLDRGILSDAKVAFAVRRHGHECMTFWIGLLTMCEDGVLAMDEDIFADSLFIEAKRYAEIREVFVSRGLVDQDAAGRLVVRNWAAYQHGESTERSRQFRERQRNADATPAQRGCNADATPAQRGCNADATPAQRDATGDIEGDGEGDEEAHEERARAPESQDPEADEDPFCSPPRGASPANDYPRKVFERFAKVPKVAQYPNFEYFLLNGPWSRIHPALKGIHSDDVFSAIDALAQVLAAPDRYWWTTAPNAETFLTKHLFRFLPAAKPLETLRKEGPPGKGAGAPTDWEKVEADYLAKSQGG